MALIVPELDQNRKPIRFVPNHSVHHDGRIRNVQFTESDGSNLRIRIPDLISAGRYNIEIENVNPSPLPVSMSISSFSRRDDVYPIEMHSYVTQPKGKKELYVFRPESHEFEGK